MAENRLTPNEMDDLYQYVKKMDDLADMDPGEDKHTAAAALNAEYKELIRKALFSTYDDWKDDSPQQVTDIIKYYLATSGRFNIQMFADGPEEGLFTKDFMPMLNNTFTNDFATLDKKQFKADPLSKTYTYTTKKGTKFTGRNININDLDTGTAKLLFTSLLELTKNNYGHTFQTATVEFSSIEYGEKLGKTLTAQTMPTLEEQAKEDDRIERRIKEFHKEIRKRGRVLKGMEWSREETKGRHAGHYIDIGIISSHGIVDRNGEPYIRINFDEDLARYVTKSPISWFPPILISTDDHIKGAFAIGCKIALQNSIDNNVVAGTDRTLKVKTILAAAAGKITSYEELRAKGRYDWKPNIKAPMENAFNELVRINYLKSWNYRDPRTWKIYTPEEVEKMSSWDKFKELDIDFDPIENPDKDERQRRKAIEKAAADQRKAEEREEKTKENANTATS